MRKYLILGSGLLFMLFSFKEQENPQWEKFLEAVAAENDPNEKVERILDIAFYSLNRMPDSTFKYADLAYSLAQEAAYINGMISAEMVRGYNTRDLGQFEEAIVILNRAKKLNEPLENKLRAAQIDDTIAGIYTRQGNFKKAIAIKEKCLEIFKMENDTNSIGVALSGIGDLFNEIEEYGKAAKYYKEGLNYCLTDRNFGYTYGNMGINFRHLNMPDSAIYYYKKGMAFMPDEPYYNIRAHSNIGILYKSQEKYKLALESYDQAEALANQINNEEMTTQTRINKAFVYVATGQFDLAEKMIDMSSEYVNEKGTIKSKLDFQKVNFRLKEKHGNFEEKYNSYRAFQILQDSVNQLDLEKQIAEFETKYETAAKEKVIVEQKIEIQKKQTQRNMLIGGLAAAIWLGLFAGLYYWNRNRLNKVIATQESEIQNRKINQLVQEKKLLSVSSMLEGQENERMRIAQDLHDSIGGLLTSVKAHFGVIQKEIKKIESIDLTSKVNQLIDEASTEVRRISHNMAPRALRLYGLKSAIADLAQQVNSKDGLKMDFEWHGAEIKLDETKEIMIYRIVQELLNNVMKHAQAKNVLVQMIVFEGEMNLLIEDDGIGFDYEEAKDGKSLGLKSIESRVDYLNGSLEVDSRSGEGTTVAIAFS